MQVSHLWNIPLTEYNDCPCAIQTTPPRTTRHLDILPRQQVPERCTVMFPDCVKHYSPCRHVHTHSECLRGKQHLGNGGYKNQGLDSQKYLSPCIDAAVYNHLSFLTSVYSFTN